VHDFNNPQPVKRYLLYVGAVYYPCFGGNGDLVGSADSVEEIKEVLPEILEKENSYYQWEITDHQTLEPVEQGGES